MAAKSTVISVELASGGALRGKPRAALVVRRGGTDKTGKAWFRDRFYSVSLRRAMRVITFMAYRGTKRGDSRANHNVFEINAAPQTTGIKFISGFGPVELVRCPVCGGEAEQYTIGQNPTRYWCVTCSANLLNRGASWYISVSPISRQFD